MAQHKLPTQIAVRDMISMLLGRPAQATEGAPVNLNPFKKCVVATFVDHRKAVRAVALFDMMMAAGTGAALSLLPASTAVEVAKSGEFDKVMKENMKEVFNVCSTLFPGPELNLSRIYLTFKTTPKPLKDALRTKGGNRIDLEITLPGYGKGRASFVLF